MAQECLFRPAGVAGDMPAKFFAHLRRIGRVFSENRINDRRRLPAQGLEIRISPFGPPIVI